MLVKEIFFLFLGTRWPVLMLMTFVQEKLKRTQQFATGFSSYPHPLPSFRVVSMLSLPIDEVSLDRVEQLGYCISVEYPLYYTHAVGRKLPIHSKQRIQRMQQWSKSTYSIRIATNLHSTETKTVKQWSSQRTKADSTEVEAIPNWYRDWLNE